MPQKNEEKHEALLDEEAWKPVQEAPSTYFYLAVLVSSLGAFVFGMSLGFTSPTLAGNEAGKTSMCPIAGPTCGLSNSSVATCGNPEMVDKMNCDLQFSTDFKSLFGSIINIGCLIGALSGGVFVDKFGKKIGMMSSMIIYCIGWLLIYMVPSPDTGTWNGVSSDASNMGTIETMLIVARLLLGFAVGITCCSVSNYQTEICTLSLRGFIGTCFQLFVVVGLFTIYLIGSSLKWDTLCLLCLFTSAVGLVLTFFLCESPVWLLTKGRDEEATAALRRLRRCDVGSVEEMIAEMKDTIDDGADPNLKESVEGGEAQEGGFTMLITDSNSRKALIIGVGLMFAQQLSGINAVMFYAGQIFAAVPGTSDDTANTYSTGMQGMQVIVTLASAFFMDKLGRRALLLFAGVGQLLGAACLIVYYLGASCTRDSDGNILTASMGVFPVISLYAYVFFFSCGMGAIPWFIMGEIFKPNVKGLASSIATAVNWLLSFAITETVDSFKDAFEDILKPSLPNAINTGMGGLFLLYGIICGLGVVFIFFFVPETKGLSAREVQHKLAGKTGPVGTGSNRHSFASSFASNYDGGFDDDKPGRNSASEHEAILNLP